MTTQSFVYEITVVVAQQVPEGFDTDRDDAFESLKETMQRAVNALTALGIHVVTWEHVF